MAPVVVVADPHGSAAELVAWLGDGTPSTVASSWQEAAGTVSYASLAGTALPLVIGPLSRAAVEALAGMRAQGMEPPVAFYTEVRATDNDATLIAQYRLVTILHRPFADADRARLAAHLDRSASPRVERVAPAVGGMVDRSEHALKAVDLGLDGPAPAPPPPKAASPRRAAGELPTGVQRLLAESGADPAPAAPAVAPGAAPAAPQRLPEPRPITIIAVEDAAATGSAILGRVGNAGQRVSVAPGYGEALRFLEQSSSGSVACELLVGPLSAEGVALVRTCRARGYPTHVIFYTESQRQSQDARLVAQYGCLAILRRGGMYDALETHILELRAFPRRTPAAPQDRAGGSAVSRSGEIAVPTASGAPARAAGAVAPGNASASGRLATPAPGGATASGSAAAGATTASGRLPPGGSTGLPATAPGGSSASGRLVAGSGGTAAGGERPTVPLRAGRSLQTPAMGTPPAPAGLAQTCPHCRQPVSVTGSVGQAVRCPRCQQGFTAR